VAAFSIVALLLLYVGIPALILVVLYWIIRRAVAAGIRDAREQTVPLGSRSD
jgi:hypothetical protein